MHDHGKKISRIDRKPATIARSLLETIFSGLQQLSIRPPFESLPE
jgi:hypothetical protein